MEVAPSTQVSGRITQYSPARTLPFAEVKDRARERLVAERSAELARKDGAAKLAAWKAAPASANLPAPVVLSRIDPQKQPPQVVEAALTADAGALPAWAGVDLGQDGYAVVKVDKIVPREPPSAQAAQLVLWLFVLGWGLVENLAYYNLLKDRYKAQILVPKPAEDAATK